MPLLWLNSAMMKYLNMPGLPSFACKRLRAQCNVQDAAQIRKLLSSDGISVSFPSHHRTESLCPPTELNKEHAWVCLRKSAMKSTSFIGPGKSRASIYQTLDTSDYMIRLTKLNVEIKNLRQKSVLSHPTLCLQTLGSRTPRFLTLY